MQDQQTAKLTQITTDLINRTTSIKYFTLLYDSLMPLEGVKSSNLFALLTEEILPGFAALAEATGWTTDKYSKKSRKFWEMLGAYDPIYCSLEPRSPERLVEIGADEESRSKAILLRSRGIVAPEIHPKIDILLEKVKFISIYAKEAYKLYTNQRGRIQR
jgi:hypothetical protein